MRTFRVALTGDFLDTAGERAYGELPESRLAAAPHVECHYLRDQSPPPGDPSYWRRFYSLEVRPEHVAGVNGLIVLRPWVKASAFSRGAPDLIVIGRSGAGYDKIDLDACTANDVAVFNVPDALDHSTASTALMFLLALAKRLPEQDRITREGRWDLQAQVLGSEIRGRTLGIIGLGRSGRELARLVAPFEMRVLAYSPRADPDEARRAGARLASLEALLEKADFVSIHCRLTPDKRGLIGAEQLALMKPTAYLVNVARGEVVDEVALVAALAERRIAGAALDVFTTEPLPKEHPLTALDNVILTPHWSASTRDVWAATGASTAEGMLRAARGEVPDNVVNPAVLDRPAFREKLARAATERG